MKSKNFIITLVILIGFFSLTIWGYSRSSLSSNAPVGGINVAGSNQAVSNLLQVDANFYDFGSISMKNGKVEKTFTILNLTNEDVVIASIITSCMCTVAYLEGGATSKGPFGMPGHGGPSALANETVKVGESRKVRVVFDPNAHGPAGVGLIDRLVAISDAKGGALQLEIKAMVTP